MSDKPALLLSYAYFKTDDFVNTCQQYDWREVIIDSGAWTAHTLGKQVHLETYTRDCKRVLAADPLRVRGVFSLDVIGDWRGSLANTEFMWKAGVPAIPVFHYGEPWDVLTGLARDYPKIGIGGIAMDHADKKLNFAKQCFSRVWPKPIHGLGYGAGEFVEALPFHSVDASSWELGPAGFGRWASFGGNLRGLSVSRKTGINLKHEVGYFLNIEHKARGRWHKIMPKIGVADQTAPTVYLAAQYTPNNLRRCGL